MPVERWQCVAFEDPHRESFLGLVKWEGFHNLSVVPKLGENDTSIASYQRTGCIPVVLRWHGLVSANRQEVVY